MNPKKQVAEFEVVVEAPGGKQKEKAFEDNAEVQVPSGLEVSEEGGDQKKLPLPWKSRS